MVMYCNAIAFLWVCGKDPIMAIKIIPKDLISVAAGDKQEYHEV